MTRTWPERVLLWVLGGWLFLTMSMAFTASANFSVLDHETMRNADQVYAKIPAGEERRLALRYAAGEINRRLFGVYDRVNLVLAAAAVALFAMGQRRGRWVGVALILGLATSMAFTFFFTPTLIELGREIDFMPRDPEPEEVARFFRLHGMNVTMEMTKMLLILFASGALVKRLER